MFIVASSLTELFTFAPDVHRILDTQPPSHFLLLVVRTATGLGGVEPLKDGGGEGHAGKAMRGTGLAPQGLAECSAALGSGSAQSKRRIWI